MATERVGDMTIEELKAVIHETVKEREKGIRKLGGGRSVKEINESIRQHRWTPPPGSKSSLELLREDRDR